MPQKIIGTVLCHSWREMRAHLLSCHLKVTIYNIYLFTYLFVCLLVYLFICLFLFVCLFIYLLVCLFIYLFILACLFIYYVCMYVCMYVCSFNWLECAVGD